MNTQQPAKTPAEIARIFGCSEQQARAHMVSGIEDLKRSLEKARASKNGKHRGFTVEWYENRISAFSAVL